MLSQSTFLLRMKISYSPNGFKVTNELCDLYEKGCNNMLQNTIIINSNLFSPVGTLLLN